LPLAVLVADPRALIALVRDGRSSRLAITGTAD
jgi:hypothetical protein